MNNMLSFFRTKSGETAVDKIISGTDALSITHSDTPDNQLDTMDLTGVVALDRKLSNDDAKDHEVLLKSLGYQNATDLKECIYGEY